MAGKYIFSSLLGSGCFFDDGIMLCALNVLHDENKVLREDFKIVGCCAVEMPLRPVVDMHSSN